MIREELERLLENITTLAAAAALASSTALTDELVSHGELMSTLLFVEILRERGIQAQWFDARKVLRTNDRFGRAEPDIAAVAELTQQQLADLVHVSSRTIISIEKGQYSPSLMLSYRMAKVFGVTVEELCCLEENLKREDETRENLS